MRSILAASAVLLLAACGGSDNAREELMPNEPERIEDTLNLTDTVIPPMFHGVWDYVEGSCARDSDLRLEISGDEMIFYESYGKAMMSQTAGDSLIVNLTMEGEGETWGEELRLMMRGDNLVVLDALAPLDDPDVMPLKRCP